VPADAGVLTCDRALEHAEGTGLEPFVLTARALHRSWLGDVDGARDDIRRGRALLAEHGDNLRTASHTMAEAQVELTARNPAAAEAAARVGYEALGELGEQGFRSTVGSYLADALLAQRSDEEAERVAIESAAMTSVDDFATHARVLAVRSLVLARRGDNEQAERLAREAVELTSRTDYLAEQGRSLVGLADVLEVAGRQEEAADALRAALTVYERKGALAPAEQIRERLASLQPA
jgi:tetratricopeptide (TPR) repeat protein